MSYYIVSLLSFATLAATANTILTPEIDTFVEDVINKWHYPAGISVAVVQQNADYSWNTEFKGYGVADLEGGKVDENTLFYIGSNSKLFDIIATGLLISNESANPRISWDTKMKTIFPSFNMTDSKATNEATIVDVMSHQTGIPNHEMALRFNVTQDEVLNSMIPNLKPSAPFREAFQYNNLMYSLLGFIPPQLTQTSLARYVKQHIFDPLGLNSTTYSVQDIVKSSISRLAKPISKDGLGKDGDPFGANVPSREMAFFNPDADEDGNLLAGPGGIVSSARDIAVWLQTLLLNGTHPVTNETIIPADVVEQVSLPRIRAASSRSSEQSDSYYGGGLFSSTYRGTNVVEHDGGVPGYSSVISRLPSNRFGVAVLTNSHEYGIFLSYIIKSRLIDAALELPPLDWESIWEAVLRQSAPITPVTSSQNYSAPTKSYESLEGRYYNPAYGPIELCHLPPNATQSTTKTEGCQNIMTGLDPNSFNSSIDNFFINREDFGSILSTHWILSHFDGDLFNITGAYYAASLNATDDHRWYLLPGVNGVAQFALSESGDDIAGFGIYGGFWEAEVPGEPNGTTVEEKAEVWFSRSK